MTIRELLELAMGENVSKVDTAIPQTTFDAMTEAQRRDIAGWYYDPWTAPMFGRLLTRSECWAKISTRLRNGELEAEIVVNVGDGYSVGTLDNAATWPCLRDHAERGEVSIRPKA